ncbi:hypothetical protein [Spirillospora sp. NBC_01491]|uniref:hypothetical protein n=1 Tax=Spirillospora sp. NBC_01491 TaxID=2976007 RepID=UPI002E2F29E5|nr:hypothetical protein [Spirillospora sp. NBC_01491]
MTGSRRVPRTRGAVSGTLLVLLGLWGGLLPFAGPYFGFGFAPDRTWVYDTDRLQLSVAPAVAAGLGGLIVLFAAGRALAMLGAWAAVLGGVWFVVGGPVATLWDVPGVGGPLGTGEERHLAEQLSGFAGLGVAVVFFGALALGRFSVAGAPEPEGYHTGPWEERPPGGAARPSGTTQPIAPVHGRYGRTSQQDPQPGGPFGTPPGTSGPPDQRVAGERGGQHR